MNELDSNLRTPGERKAFQEGYSLGYEHGLSHHEQLRGHRVLAQGFNRFVGYAVLLAVITGIAWLYLKG